MSTTAASARQWQRIDYHVPVQLQLRLGVSEPKTVLVQAVNLSEGGMQVSAPDALPIGEDVTCSMLLEGRHRSLPGRVRWAKPTLPGIGAPGIGIQFRPLSDDDSGLLRDAVLRGVRGDQPIELYFPSLKDPVHARAFTSDDGLQIIAALPVLARDSAVEFKLGGRGPRFLGRIANVSVRERSRTPQIEVELALQAREMPRFRRYTMYGEEEPASEAMDAAADAGSDAADKARTRKPTIQMWIPEDAVDQVTTIDRPPAALDSAQKTVEGSLGSPALEPRAASTHETALAHRRARAASVLHSLGVLLAGAAVGALAVWFYLSPKLSAHAAQHAAQHVRKQPPPAAVMAPAQASPARDATGVTAVTPANQPVQPAHEAAAAAPGTPPNAGVPGLQLIPATAAPVVTSQGLWTEVAIPFSGSAEGLHSLLWAQPRAVVVNLPAAQVALPLRRYLLGVGAADRMVVTGSAGATQVRIFVAADVIHHSIATDHDLLRVRFEQSGAAPARAR